MKMEFTYIYPIFTEPHKSMTLLGNTEHFTNLRDKIETSQVTVIKLEYTILSSNYCRQIYMPAKIEDNIFILRAVYKRLTNLC